MKAKIADAVTLVVGLAALTLPLPLMGKEPEQPPRPVTVSQPKITHSTANKNSRKHDESIEGVWKVISAEHNGRPMVVKEVMFVAGWMIFDSDQIACYSGACMQYSLDTTTNLNRIKLKNSQRSLHGVYLLHGDTLTLYYVSDFPWILL